MHDFELKNIEGFDINNFKQINFIVGKNGVGKSLFIDRLIKAYNDGLFPFYNRAKVHFRPHRFAIDYGPICIIKSYLPDLSSMVKKCINDLVEDFDSKEVVKLVDDSLKFFLENEECFLNHYNEKCLLDYYNHNKFIFNLLCNVFFSSTQTIFISEPFDSIFHHSILQFVATLIYCIISVEPNLKFISITQSHDLINQFWVALQRHGDVLGLHRLEEIDGKLCMVSFPKDELDTAMELNWEVR